MHYHQNLQTCFFVFNHYPFTTLEVILTSAHTHTVLFHENWCGEVQVCVLTTTYSNMKCITYFPKQASIFFFYFYTIWRKWKVSGVFYGKEE